MSLARKISQKNSVPVFDIFVEYFPSPAKANTHISHIKWYVCCNKETLKENSMKQRNVMRMLFCIALQAAFFTILTFTPKVLAEDTNPARIGPNTTLTFAEQKAILTSDSKSKLDLLIKNARVLGKINEVQVAAWSDNPAPRENEQLSKPDRVLAEKRANVINKYLKSRAKVAVSTYNMAEHASWLDKIFGSANSDLKSEIGYGGDMPMSKEEFQIIKNNGQPSKAVVLVIMKHLN